MASCYLRRGTVLPGYDYRHEFERCFGPRAKTGDAMNSRHEGTLKVKWCIGAKVDRLLVTA